MVSYRATVGLGAPLPRLSVDPLIPYFGEQDSWQAKNQGHISGMVRRAEREISDRPQPQRQLDAVYALLG